MNCLKCTKSVILYQCTSCTNQYSILIYLQDVQGYSKNRYSPICTRVHLNIYLVLTSLSIWCVHFNEMLLFDYWPMPKNISLLTKYALNEEEDEGAWHWCLPDFYTLDLLLTLNSQCTSLSRYS